MEGRNLVFRKHPESRTALKSIFLPTLFAHQGLAIALKIQVPFLVAYAGILSLWLYLIMMVIGSRSPLGLILAFSSCVLLRISSVWTATEIIGWILVLLSLVLFVWFFTYSLSQCLPEGTSETNTFT